MKKVTGGFVVSFIFLTAWPLAAGAATFEISGWIPYWQKTAGVAQATEHLSIFTELSPFGFTVDEAGNLIDTAKLMSAPWPDLITKAKAKKIRIVPTVTWTNGQAIDTVLKNETLRAHHIKQIVKMVNSGGYDGVDIDYENKLAETNQYFSLFLKELYTAMGKKWVICSIEARTPLDSRFDTVPEKIEYANDFVAINKYCDRVKLMAYDQGRIDLKLNRSNLGSYRPVADTRWVEKVVKLAAESINKNKIIIGVPTYGYEYAYTADGAAGDGFKALWTVTASYAADLAGQVKLTPRRNEAGELSFSYLATSSNKELHLVWWSDAVAIKSKIDLAKKLGVRGVAIFKLDGKADPALWTILK